MPIKPVERAPCDEAAPLRLGVLVSGTGATLKALIDACAAHKLPASIELVLSDSKEAPAIERARNAGLTTRVVPLDAFDDEAGFEAALIEALENRDVEVVCLSGYTGPLSPRLAEAFPSRVLNMHASLLPAFEVEHPIREALIRGVRITGCTLYFLDATAGLGAILLQSALRVGPDDDEEALAVRINVLQQRTYLAGIGLLAEGRVSLADGQARIEGAPSHDDVLEWWKDPAKTE